MPSASQSEIESEPVCARDLDALEDVVDRLRRTVRPGCRQLPSLYAGSWKRFGLIAPSAQAELGCRLAQLAKSSTRSQGMWSATDGATPV